MHREAQTKPQKKEKPSEFKFCKKSFTIDEGFWKMKNNPNKITEALHLYFSGTSLRKTQAHLGVFRESNCSYVTILEWIRKYAGLEGILQIL